MKVSVITTCLNREHTVRKTVWSLMNQTYPSIEHIIVDGQSTDGTVRAIRECASPLISQFVCERDHGTYEALNKGIRLAKGEIVGWLHSDDVYYNNHVIADVVDVFERTGCDLVYGNGLFVGANSKRWVLRDWVSGEFAPGKLRNGWLPIHTSVFVRREMFEKYGFYREDYQISSDTEWLLRVMLRPEIKVAYLNQYMVIMTYGGLSTNWRKTLLRWREDLGIYQQVGLSPRVALMKKVLRKLPQFISAPFRRLPLTYWRHYLDEQDECILVKPPLSLAPTPQNSVV